MLKKIAVFFIILFLTASLAGCATVSRQKDLEVQGLKNQISALEAQIEAKDEQISTLQDALAESMKQEETEAVKKTSGKKVIGEVKSHPSVKQIQAALQNAGYNPGSIDGRMGKQTKKAIKQFQRANNLKDDGKVGKATWDLLKEYLYNKVK